MKPEMKKLIIANLPYLLFVYLFGKLGQAYRLAEGIDLSQKLLHFADGCAAAFESAAPSFHLFDLLIGVAGAAALRLMVYCKAAPETCTCTTKCAAGAVNTNCPVCKTNMTECTGPEPEPQEPEETEQPQEDEAKSTGMGGLVVFLVVALIGGGAALYFFKFKKPKADTKGGDELDEYDFGEDEDEPAPEDEEPAQDKEE